MSDETPKVRVDQFSRRSGDDALEGSFVQVQDGEHAGQVGAFTKVIERDKDGYPATVLLRMKDLTYTHEFVVEPYSNVRTVRGY